MAVISVPIGTQLAAIATLAFALIGLFSGICLRHNPSADINKCLVVGGAIVSIISALFLANEESATAVLVEGTVMAISTMFVCLGVGLSIDRPRDR